jgi:cyanophycinase
LSGDCPTKKLFRGNRHSKDAAATGAKRKYLAFYHHRSKLLKTNIMKIRIIFLITFFCLKSLAQTTTGKLFIIGGGKRSNKLVTQMLTTANLSKKDYITVLPMASEEPDSAYIYFKKQVEKLTNLPIIMLHFTKNNNTNIKLLDSLSRSKLIYILGGDQNRFMGVVANSDIFKSIHKAHKNGSTIAGTSAGAAVISEKMITGNQKLNSKYEETFDNIRHTNLETAQGLGLIKTAIIDQHFLIRSRYNRLISALVDFPNLTGIGIDESTAIIVSDNKAQVVGDSQVLVFRKPKKIQKQKNNKVSVENFNLSIFVEGQSFLINTK